MALGTVNELGTSQAGKPKVKIDGKWYFLGRCSTEGLTTGIQVEYESKSFTTDSGKELWGLQSWKRTSNGNGHAPAPSAVSDDAEMRFISNCVGSAITSGKCDDPTLIVKWAQGAKSALKALKADFDGDEDIPF